MSENKKEIRRFVVEHFLFGEDHGLADDASLLQQGVMDSTGVLELVMQLEATYGFKVEDQELIPDNLDSIQRLADFVERKTRTAPPMTSAA